MVNSNYGHGRVRVRAQSDAPGPQLAVNPDAASLGVGDVVVPNYADLTAQADHPPGVILQIAAGLATVRWAPGDRTTQVPREHLTKR
ncbi:hypothetical protein AB0J74_23000 [Asanoa sp. NPDC049573]|uniref:hypothetical protein n=1 Tax=Asanoa sp. NPDC049573 TaxID=3155396 RepID=UPI00341D6F22